MDCKITCFERVLYSTKTLPKQKLKTAIKLIQEYSFQDLLDFCVKNKCFTLIQSYTIYDGIILWENFEDTYYEEDQEKLLALYDRIGITSDVFAKSAN